MTASNSYRSSSRRHDAASFVASTPTSPVMPTAH